MNCSRWIVAAAVLVGVLARAQDVVAVEQPAPNFRLPAYARAGGPTALGLDTLVGPGAGDRDARLVLLSFMASFCAPCKKEMPYLQRLHTTYADLGLRVVMVSIDDAPAGMAIIDGLIAEHGITYPVLKDRFNIVARRYLGPQSPLPSVFLIRRDGTVSKVHRGYDENASDVFQQEVELALGLAPGASRMPAPTPTPATPEAPAKAGKAGAKPATKASKVKSRTGSGRPAAGKASGA